MSDLEANMKLPRVHHFKYRELAGLILALLMLHKNTFVSVDDIKVECGEDWDFCKVSLFRYSKAGSGHGSKEWREKKWEQQKAAMEELFDMHMPPAYSWRWPRSMPHLYPREMELDTPQGEPLPGVTYFIKTEKQA